VTADVFFWFMVIGGVAAVTFPFWIDHQFMSGD
jgi:hypothetical protein